VREHGDRAEHHPPCHGGYVLGAVRDVGRRDSKPEEGQEARPRGRASVDEGSDTCKRVVPAWHEGRHHQRRRGGAERLRVPPRLEGRGIHMGREAVVLTLVATGRSAGVGAVRWCGSPARRKTKAAARRRGSRGSRGSRCSRRRRGRLLPRVALVFAANGSFHGRLHSSFSPLHSLLLRRVDGWTGEQLPEAARVGISPWGSVAA
jgi:hypothetical protein